MKASSWLLVPCILFIGLVFCAEAKSARKRARVTTTPAPSSAPPTESTDNNSTADDEVEEYDPYYDQYDQYVEPPPPPPPPKPTGFEESFVHKVMSFAGNDDDVEEKVPPKREDAPYKHAYKWKNGRWKKYPLYLIILGGWGCMTLTFVDRGWLTGVLLSCSICT